MTRPPVHFAALLLISLSFAGPAALAQSSFLGEAFPLTNASHAPSVPGMVRLVATSGEPALFWLENGSVRMTRATGNSSRLGRIMFDPGGAYSFDAVWTGSGFLVAAETQDGVIVQTADARGTRKTEPVLVSPGGQRPRLALHGSRGLLVYANNNQLQARVVTAGGEIIDSDQPTVIDGEHWFAVAATEHSFVVASMKANAIVVTLLNSFGDILAETVVPGIFPTGVALASDGERYLLVSTELLNGGRDPVFARVIERDGSVGAPLLIEIPRPGRYSDPHVVWSGSDWIVSYIHLARSTQQYLARVDATGTAVTEKEQVAGAIIDLESSRGRVLAAIYEKGAFSVSELPLREHERRTVAHVPRSQTLLAAAESPDATLVIWSEASDTHAGIRRRDGNWSQRRIAGGANAAVAKWSGAEFLVVLQQSEPMAIRLDVQGAPLGEPVRAALFPDDIVYAGTTWIAADSGRVRPLFSDSGPVWRAPLRGAYTFAGETAIAWNGNGFFVVWVERFSSICSGGCSVPVALVGMHVSANLRQTNEVPIELTTDGEEPSVTWNGTAYVVRCSVLWSGNRVLFVEPGRQPRGPRWDEVDHHELMQGLVPWRTRRITLDDGRAAVVFVSFLREEPYYGANRVMMRVASRTPLPDNPAGPAAMAFARDGRYVVEWSPPRQPVSGYRVELMTSDGVWEEFDRVLGPDERSIAITPPAPDAMVSFRVRAWNDAGLGAYSAVAVVHPLRRRPAG